MQQIFIDRFTMPVEAKEEFFERVRINRDLIHSLSGFIKDDIYERIDGDILYVVTTAFWESAAAIENAKNTVMAEYKRQGFNMQEMFSRLNITLDRGIFTKLDL
ncbi:antibiotic biosynthesis monooxygenase [Chitinophagaceae bacterium 26-R-25]|nr:antibiotic biosynthesis monooxygenase [Chitinophagaceae bacterium 26-R-25]